ncbi:MAG: hypothetical protein RIR01_2080 [Bacteroidota bacterium]|jgi:hypothetical protein
MEGLGDLVAKVAEVTGIKTIVEEIVGEDCGCQERQRKLNSMFPFTSSKDVYYKNKLYGDTSLDSK